MDTGPALLQVTLALGLILGLVFVAAWLARRFGGTGLRATSVIRVLAAAPIGTRERILLVEVHGQQLLLGVTAGQVTRLHAFEPGAPAVEQPVNDFQRTLANWMGRS